MNSHCSERGAITGFRAVMAVLLLAVSVAAGATAQIPDSLVVDGKPNILFAEPLGPALEANPHLRERLLKYISINRCSASWRGYKATWEVRENVLYLVKVDANPCSSKRTPVPLSELFPDTTGPVHAIWFTGTLRVPQGRQIEYVHMGYETRYERYLILLVENGHVVNRSTKTSAKR